MLHNLLWQFSHLVLQVCNQDQAVCHVLWCLQGTKILATTDPDGWKVVFVDNEDFLAELK